MQPIFLTVGSKRPLEIIPDSQAHMDGHPILTYTYSIYKSKPNGGNGIVDKEILLEQDTKKTNPNYMGFITFEQPGKLFTYTADGMEALESDEVEEIIEQLNHYRDTPQLWSI